jgi:cytochrome c-type biogenesis protein CcmH/NrfG
MVQSTRTSDPEEKTKRMDDAEAAYREALRLNPDIPLALSNLARALVAREKFDEALSLYEKLVVTEPRDFENWAGLGHARLQLDDPAGAVQAYEAALERNRNAPVKTMLGAALLGVHRYPEAAAVFRDALQSGDRDPRVFYGLASARVEEANLARAAGRPVDPKGLAEAESALREMLREDPGHAPARELLRQVEALRPGDGS